MPVVKDQMGYGSPTPPQESNTDAISGDWTPLVDIHLNSSHNDSYFAQKPCSASLSNEGHFAACIRRLSGISEAQPDTPDSTDFPSIHRTTNDWGTPATLDSTVSPPQSPAVVTPEHTYTAYTYTQSPVQQPQTSWRNRRPNPKLAKARKAHAPSALQREIRYDEEMEPGDNSEHPTQHSQAISYSYVPRPDTVRATSDPGGMLPSSSHGLPADAPPRLRGRNVPYFAAHHGIRLPMDSRMDSRAEELYRFPTSEMLQAHGIECGSAQCSLNVTPTGTPQTTPAGTPRDSPASTRPSSLRNFRAFEDILVDTESDTDSVDSLRTRVGGRGVASLPRSSAPFPEAPPLPASRRPAPCPEESFYWQTDQSDVSTASPGSYSIDSKPEASKKPTPKRCILLRRLKKIFWRRKIKSDTK